MEMPAAMAFVVVVAAALECGSAVAIAVGTADHAAVDAVHCPRRMLL